MKRIKIPFLKEFKKDLLSGKKTMTSRNKKYGESGDRFTVDGKEFELTKVTRQTLFSVSHMLYEEEGFAKPSEFIEVWKRLHPKKGYSPNQLIWLHIFKKREE